MTSKPVSVAALLLAISGGALCAAKRAPAVNNSDRGPCPVTHRFLKGGWKSKGVGIVRKNLTIEWQQPDDSEISDAWHLMDGSVVHSFSDRANKAAGIRLYGPDKKLKWTYNVDAGRDNHSCQPLPGGHFLAGESAKGAAFMVEIDRTGKKVKETPLELPDRMQELALKDIHHVFRNVRKTAAGTWLAGCMKYNKAVEWSADGKFLREFPDCHYSAVRLADGNTLVSGKKGVLEYDKRGQVVWSFGATDFEALKLRISMICGIQRLPNGNTVISNVDHGTLTKTGDNYRLVEVTKDKKLVWWVDDPTLNGMNLGSIQVLDAEGDPTNFEVSK